MVSESVIRGSRECGNWYRRVFCHRACYDFSVVCGTLIYLQHKNANLCASPDSNSNPNSNEIANNKKYY